MSTLGTKHHELQSVELGVQLCLRVVEMGLPIVDSNARMGFKIAVGAVVQWVVANDQFLSRQGTQQAADEVVSTESSRFLREQQSADTG